MTDFLSAASLHEFPSDEHFEIALEASCLLSEHMILDSNKYKHPTPVISLAFLGAACALAKFDGKLSLADWKDLCEHIYQRLAALPGDPAIVEERLKKNGF